MPGIDTGGLDRTDTRSGCRPPSRNPVASSSWGAARDQVREPLQLVHRLFRRGPARDKGHKKGRLLQRIRHVVALEEHVGPARRLEPPDRRALGTV